MADKNLGPAVSGYRSVDDRAFESTVFQAGKPVLDAELNLAQDLSSGYALDLSKVLAPSGWLREDHLNTSDPMGLLYVSSATANTLALSGSLKALVNGWTVLVHNTEVAAGNQVTLPANPVGNGAKRTDLVILEVWRRLIAPDVGDGKSPSGLVWRNGNVKIPAASDVALNFSDQMIDPVFLAETTKRVQIQYRLRVISGVDVHTYPSGMDDPVVIANTVPASAGAPDGTPVLGLSYLSQSSNGDPGLWRAGDGDPSNGLGTVDGYMYAIPLCAVFRRNTTPFDKNLNHNGGVVSPGPSDRPDGYFSDIIVANDVADLRQIVSTRGWDYREVLEKNFGLLLDNKLTTEWTTTPNGGGYAGHTVLWADEVGTLPGDGSVTGDTPGAEFIGQFDCTRRFFTDRSNYEILTLKVVPGDSMVSTATWQAGTVVTIPSSLLCQWPYPTTIDFHSRIPSGTRIIDVSSARIQGVPGTSPNVALDIGVSNVSDVAVTPYPIDNVQGVGSYPMTNIVITLGTPPVSALDAPMYIDLLVAYPAGQGLTRTPTSDFGAASFVINNPAALPATSPVLYSAMQTQSLDLVHRQVQLQYKTVLQTFTSYVDSTSGQDMFFLPERIETLSEVRVGGVPDAGAHLEGDSGRVVHLTAPAAAGTLLEVDYQAIRPMPQSTGVDPGVQFTIYYEARAAQSIRSGVLGTSVDLIPRWISPYLYSITTGSGSQGESYPYPYAYVQTGGILKESGMFSGEHELDGNQYVAISDFDAETGFLKVPAYIPYVPSSESVGFTRDSGDVDVEDRSYFSGSLPGVYAPNSFGPSLSDSRVHKVILPTLMELKEDGSIGKKGTLLMVNLVRWSDLDPENSIKMLPSSNTTIASVVRVAGNLINRRV